MKIIYASEKLKTVCTSAKAAKKFFGGNDALARSLMSRINAIQLQNTKIKRLRKK